MAPRFPLRTLASPQAILEALPAHIAVLDERGAIVEVNAAWRRFATDNGLAPGRCGPGDNYLDACAEAAAGGVTDAQVIRDALVEVIAGTRDAFMHEYACHSPGARRWFRMTASPIRDDLQRGAVVMHIDITQRRLAEESLADRAEMLRAAQRLAGLGSWHVDCATLGLSISAEALGLLGLAECQAPATYADLVERVHAADRAHVDARLRTLMLGGEPLDMQHRIDRVDGTVRWVRARVARLEGGEGLAPRLSATWMDITERRAAGEALRESEARYRQRTLELANILDSSVDLICTLDGDGCFVRVSAASRRLLGYEPQELVGRSVLDFIVEEDRQRSTDASIAIRNGSPVNAFENRMRHRDGSVVPVSWSAWWSGAQQLMVCVARDITESLLAAAAARHLSERLSATLETMTDGFITLNRELRITYVNHATELAVRTPREQMIGRSIHDALPGAERFIARYREAMAGNRAVEFEEVYAPLGIRLEVRAFPGPEGIAVYFRDVTERYRVEQALRESEERFKLVAEATTDATWDWNIETGASWWSEGWARLFGQPHGEVVHGGEARWHGCIHPEDRERVVRSLADAIEGDGVLWTERYRMRRADGSFADVVDRGYVMRDVHGAAMRMVGGVSDISAQLEAQQRLHEQAHLLDAARDAIQVLDLDHRILSWNRGSEALFGWTAEQAIGRSADELLQIEGERFARAQEALVRDGSWTGELEKVTRDGRKVVLDCRWTMLRDGGRHRILAIETDVTERRALERQLLRSQRMESIGTLAGGIAHDLNNVLTPILMSANLLRRPGMDMEEAQLLDAIAKSARRGADMITQLLSFARGVEGRHIAFDPGAVVRDVRRIVAETFPRDIDISLEIEPGVRAVRGDPTQLHQVVLNLCLNARDAMPTGGMLAIWVRNAGPDEAGEEGRLPGEQVSIVVSDTGTGMRDEVLEKIFDPFFTTKDPGKGTGLGLPTSLAIVRRHGGVMRVSSTFGVGSRFAIYLPACEEPAQPPAPAGPEHPRGQGETVLLVDDEAPIRDVGEQTLRAYGYEVVAAADGTEAVALYAKLRRNIDIVLVDMMMPVMDGLATIHALRRLNPAVRIIATSGIADDRHVGLAADAGVASFLPKPYTTEALLSSLRRALPRKAAAQ